MNLEKLSIEVEICKMKGLYTGTLSRHTDIIWSAANITCGYGIYI